MEIVQRMMLPFIFLSFAVTTNTAADAQDLARAASAFDVQFDRVEECGHWTHAGQHGVYRLLFARAAQRRLVYLQWLREDAQQNRTRVAQIDFPVFNDIDAPYVLDDLSCHQKMLGGVQLRGRAYAGKQRLKVTVQASQHPGMIGLKFRR
jgi:hypothetical protein